MKTARNTFIFLLAFLSAGALFGGGALIISPSGELIQMPLNLLDNSLFTNYTIPGIILFTVLGLFPALLLRPLVKKPSSPFLNKFNLLSDMHWSWSFGMYIALALIIWLQVQMSIIRGVHWAHTFYMFLAVAIIAVGILPKTRNFYKNG